MAAQLITGKRLLTHYCNELETIISRFKEEELETLNVAAAQGESASQYIRESLQRLNEAIGALDAATLNIGHTLTDYATKFANLDYPMEKDKQDFEEYSAKAEKALTSATDYSLVLKARVHAFTAVKAEPGHNQQSGSIQIQTPALPHERLDLPTLPVPKFQGNIWEWDNFWELFNENVHSRNIPELCKFNYLLQALRGDALALIKKFQVAKGNYPKAIEFLQHKYGNREELVTHLIEKLGKCHLHSTSIRDQRTLFEQLQVIIMQLQQKEVQVDNQWMYQQVLTKFPDTVQRKVLVRKQAAVNSGATFNLSLLIQYLEEEISTDEMLAVYMKNTKPDPTPSKPENRRPDRTRTYFGTCMYCQGSHKSADCEKYTTPQKRSTYLRENKLCLICASAQHSTSNCKKRMCFRCGGPHHTSCCFRGDATTDKAVPRKTSPPLSEKKKPKSRDLERRPPNSEAAKVNAVSEDNLRQDVNPTPKSQLYEKDDNLAKWEAACTIDGSVDILTLHTSSAQPSEEEVPGTRQASRHSAPRAANNGAQAAFRRTAMLKPKSNAARDRFAAKCPTAVAASAKSLRPTPEAKNTRLPVTSLQHKKAKPQSHNGKILLTVPIQSLHPDASSPTSRIKAPVLMASTVLTSYPEQSKKSRTTVSSKPDEAFSTDEERDDTVKSVTPPSKPGPAQPHGPSQVSPEDTHGMSASKSFGLILICNTDVLYQALEKGPTAVANQLVQCVDNLLSIATEEKTQKENPSETKTEVSLDIRQIHEIPQRHDFMHSSVTGFLLEADEGGTKVTPCSQPKKLTNRTDVIPKPTDTMAVQTINSDTGIPTTPSRKDVETQTQPSFATVEQVSGKSKTTRPFPRHQRTDKSVQVNYTLGKITKCSTNHDLHFNEKNDKAIRLLRQQFKFHDEGFLGRNKRRSQSNKPMRKSEIVASVELPFETTHQGTYHPQLAPSSTDLFMATHHGLPCCPFQSGRLPFYREPRVRELNAPSLYEGLLQRNNYERCKDSPVDVSNRQSCKARPAYVAFKPIHPPFDTIINTHSQMAPNEIRTLKPMGQEDVVTGVSDAQLFGSQQEDVTLFHANFFNNQSQRHQRSKADTRSVWTVPLSPHAIPHVLPSSNLHMRRLLSMSFLEPGAPHAYSAPRTVEAPDRQKRTQCIPDRVEAGMDLEKQQQGSRLKKEDASKQKRRKKTKETISEEEQSLSRPGVSRNSTDNFCVDD